MGWAGPKHTKWPWSLAGGQGPLGTHREILARLDAVQTRFLRDAGIGEEDALVDLQLSPVVCKT